MALVDYSNVLLGESLENENQQTAAQTSWLNQGDIEIAVNSILRNIGENPEREGLLNTPNRVARMYQELTEGYHIDPEKLINDAIFTVDYDEMVVVKDIDFYSMCEHHMLPFFGRAHVAYIPNGKVIGLSKIPRIVEMFARRLQIQEQMTSQIANFLQEQLQPQGVAVVVEGAHMCAMMRGVKKANTKMVTSKMLGCFRENENQQTAAQTSWLNQGDIEIAVNSILRNIGENPEREGLLNTPNRVARMYQELTGGYHIDPEKLINDAIFTVDYDEMVVVKDIDFYSMCEHHMLPFYGRAHVAYIPNGKVIGLSKIPRIVDMFARRLQIQEQMTSQIANFLQEQLQPQGVAVVVEGAHMCAMMRGVKKANTKMITSKMLGCFRENEKTRAEFLSHIKSNT